MSLMFPLKTKRTACKKCKFDYESYEKVNINALDTFVINYFLRVVDEAMQSSKHGAYNMKNTAAIMAFFLTPQHCKTLAMTTYSSPARISPYWSKYLLFVM